MDVSGSRRTLIACATAALTALGASGFISTASSAGATVAPFGPPGLDNPRGLAFGPDGRLYVAEAGHGGTECLPPHNGEEPQCVGFTSGISSIDAFDGHKVLSGEFSIAGHEGTAATGIDGISLDNDGGLFAIETGSTDVLPTHAPPGVSQQTLEMARAEVGRLIELRPGGRWRDGAAWSHPDGPFTTIANVGHFDFQWSGEHKELVPEQFPDANPYGVYAAPNERFVVDAASNTLDEVRWDGSVKVIAFFPNPPHSDAVPTCVDRGPDGAFYVGELTGAGNVPGASVVWRVVEGQQPQEWAKGLTAVTGCGFGSDGRFYAAEFSTLGFESFAAGTGALVRVPPHSSTPIPLVSNSPGHADSPLSFPGGFAAGPNGGIYVSNWSIAPASLKLGQVVRITP
jgi:hypothetical protein